MKRARTRSQTKAALEAAIAAAAETAIVDAPAAVVDAPAAATGDVVARDPPVFIAPSPPRTPSNPGSPPPFPGLRVKRRLELMSRRKSLEDRDVEIPPNPAEEEVQLYLLTESKIAMTNLNRAKRGMLEAMRVLYQKIETNNLEKSSFTEEQFSFNHLSGQYNEAIQDPSLSNVKHVTTCIENFIEETTKKNAKFTRIFKHLIDAQLANAARANVGIKDDVVFVGP